MKIGLFFGSFDPVHYGHMMVVSNFLEKRCFDKIWIVLSPQSPHKTNRELLDKKHRLIMLDRAFKDEKDVLISDVEFRIQKPNYTIETITYLKNKFPTDSFSLIMGSDNFSKINTWKNYEKIIKDYKIYVYPRKGFDINKQQKSKNTIYVNFPIVPISSTSIRKQFLDGILKNISFIKKNVPEPVLDYITSKNLY